MTKEVKTKRAKKTCYWCHAPIKFDTKVRSPNGRTIPLNMDDSWHNCPDSPYNKRLKGAQCFARTQSEA